MESLECNKAAQASSIILHYHEASKNIISKTGAHNMFSIGLVKIILPEEIYFYALSYVWNMNPYEKLNFRPSVYFTLH